MRTDITTREDVELLVTTFYNSVFEDVMLAPVFLGTIGDDLESHYAKLFDFWEDQLLGTFKFQGNPMQVHVKLSKKFKLDNDMFDVWLNLFNSTVNQLFEGPIANKAKERALSIATVIRIKLNS